MCRFTVPNQGNVSVITYSVGADGSQFVQASNSVEFKYDSPSLRSNGKDAVLPSVPANGTGVVRIIGRYLYEPNSTVVTRVTIGGTSAGLAIPVENVDMGPYTPPSSGRRLGSEPNQYLDITVSHMFRAA
jgi:hypothetical protein